MSGSGWQLAAGGWRRIVFRGDNDEIPESLVAVVHQGHVLGNRPPGALVQAGASAGSVRRGKEAAMTTLRTFGLGEAIRERPVASPSAVARLLLPRLHQESDRQVPFSQAKLLLREAASVIERLEGELARATAALEAMRAARQGP